TVNFAAEILGNSSLSSATGGLLGTGEPSGADPTSRLARFQSSPGNLGVTQSTILQNAAALPSSGADMTTSIAQYQSAWGTIRTAANAASTTLAELADFCAKNGSPENAAAARSAITVTVAPVLVQADAAAVTAATASAMVQKVQSELTSGESSYALDDMQQLQTMAPTTRDVANVEQETQAFNMAAAIPAGSLNVAGGTLIDRMSLLSTNAAALKSACVVSSATASEGSATGD
ncbi:MAG: hypothetical protein AAB368_14065, partial [bacterium]